MLHAKSSSISHGKVIEQASQDTAQNRFQQRQQGPPQHAQAPDLSLLSNFASDLTDHTSAALSSLSMSNQTHLQYTKTPETIEVFDSQVS